MVQLRSSSPMVGSTSTPNAKSDRNEMETRRRRPLPSTPKNKSTPSKQVLPSTPDQAVNSTTASEMRQDLLSTPINPPPMRNAVTSLPRPLFSERPETYSTKKERKLSGTRRMPPPRPPAKSCPPKSRIFGSSDLYKAQTVTFLDSPDGKTVTGTPFKSNVYDTTKKESYFEQAFTVISEIGAGYFSTVYSVVSKEDGQRYAIKIAREKYKGHGDRNRKLEEVRKHQFLPLHSNLVKFYNSWEEQGRLYQQFELCNQSLQDYADKNERIPEQQVWSYLIDLLQAVQHLHNHDLVHMDIKPDNIFIGHDGICKLGDFGLILDLSNPSVSGAREGDSRYLAPEALRGVFTKACDVFSLGTTILELACDLDLPTGGELWSQLRMRGPDPSLTLGLSPELRRVVQLMMTPDPERRPSVNQILELPSVAAALHRRKRERLWSSVKAKLARMFSCILLMWVFQMIYNKVYDFFAISSRATPVKTPVLGQGSTAVNNASAWDTFSDDEVDILNSSEGSELAAPLQESSSSDGPSNQLAKSEPLPEKSRFKLLSQTGRKTTRNPDASPLRRPRTEPRPRVRFVSSAARSPQKRLFFNDDMATSPDAVALVNGNQSAATSNDSQTTESGFLDGVKITLKPKSLAETFDCFSDDD